MIMTTALQTNIKRQLAIKKLSIAELERRAGLPHAVINIMRGKSKNPSIKVAKALARELGCSIEELIGEEEIKSLSALQQYNNKVEIEALNENKNLPWDQALSKAVFDCLQECFSQRQNITVSSLITCWQEVYSYCYNSPNKTVDRRFVEWFINRHLSL